MEKENTTSLCECFNELDHIEKSLNTWADEEGEPDIHILILLIRVTMEKLNYFQKKYDFKVEDSDHFFVEDLLKFAKKANAG